MINNHYIPQLILRHFCEDGKILYYDIEKHTTELRTTKSVFLEKGYYPDKLEKELCHKIEVQFANVLNKKILCENYKITLTEEDLLTLKKYLIITILRVRYEDMVHNAWYQVLKRDGFITEEDSLKDFFSGDFFENINKILECRDLNTLLEITDENLNLFTFVKDVIYSYNVFVKSNNCKEDFIISDRGWAGYRGPISVKKLNAMLNMLEVEYDPYIDMLLHMSSPLDYAIFPLANNTAVIMVSPAFKMCLPGAPYNILYPENAPSLSRCLGFGSANTIAVPDNKFLRDGTKEYRYNIQQLPRQDVVFLNELLINNAEKFIGFGNSDRVRISLDKCNIKV